MDLMDILQKKVKANETLYKGNLLKLDVTIENNDSTNFSAILLSISVTDSNKNELIKSSSYTDFPNDIESIEVAPGKKEKASIYFTDERDDDFNYTVKNDTIKKAKYLKISVLASVDKKEAEKGNVIGKSEDYYIEVN